MPKLVKAGGMMDDDDSDSDSGSDSSSDSGSSSDSSSDSDFEGGIDFSLKAGAAEGWCNETIRRAIRVIVICAIGYYGVKNGVVEVSKFGEEAVDKIKKVGARAYFYASGFQSMPTDTPKSIYDTLWSFADSSFRAHPVPSTVALASTAYFLKGVLSVPLDIYKNIETPMCIFLSVNLYGARKVVYVASAVGRGVLKAARYAKKAVVGGKKGCRV